MGAFVRGGMATEVYVNNEVVEAKYDLLPQIALTNFRMLLGSAVATGALVAGKQWELETDEWGGGLYYVTGSPDYYSYTANPLDQVPAMTGYTAPSGTVTTSGDTNGGSWPAWRAFDDSADYTAETNGWISQNPLPAWVAYQFPSAKVIVKVTIRSAGNTTYYTRAPKTFTIQGSNDGTNWDTLNTQTNVAGWGQGEQRVYQFSNTTAYTHYRLHVTATQQNDFCCISELEFCGVIGGDATFLQPAPVSVSIAPAAASVFFLYKDDSGSAVLGTDCTVDISRDNGTTWTAATLESLAAFDGNYTVIKARADVSGQPSGTQLLCRIKTLNSKAQRIAAPAIYAE